MTQQEQKDWTENVRWADDRQALLDDFAKAVIQSIVHVENPKDLMDKYHIAGIVSDSYDIASAMIQERERRNNNER